MTDFQVDDRGDWKVLQTKLLELSKSKIWTAAVKEWSLVDVHICDKYGDEECLCGHKIKEACELVNVENKNTAVVGNVCVKTFMNEPNKIMRACKQVIKKGAANASLNQEAIDFGLRSKWLTDWEYAFYSDVHGKRAFTDAQRAVRTRINNKFLGHVRRREPEVEEGKEKEPKRQRQMTFEEKGLTLEVLDEMVEKKVLSNWDRTFMHDKLQRRSFSEKQMIIVERIQDKLKAFKPQLSSDSPAQANTREGDLTASPATARTGDANEASGATNNPGSSTIPYTREANAANIAQNEPNPKPNPNPNTNPNPNPNPNTNSNPNPNTNAASSTTPRTGDVNAANSAPKHVPSPSTPGARQAASEWLTMHQLIAAKESKYVTDWEFGFYLNNIQKFQSNPDYYFSDKVKNIKKRIEVNIKNKRVRM